MSQIEPNVSRILLLTLDKLGKKKEAASEHMITLVQKAKQHAGFFSLFSSVEFWMCVCLTLYFLALLFVGVKQKRFVLFFIVMGILASCLSPATDSIFTIFEKCLGKLFKSNDSKLYEFVMSNKRIPLVIVCFIITLGLLAIFSWLRYLVLGVVLFEVYHWLDDILSGNSTTSKFWIICACSFIITILLSVVFGALFNVVLAIVFASNGSYLFLTMCCIVTGYPSGFDDFYMLSFDSAKWKTFQFKCNFAIWLVLMLIGLKSQFSFRTRSKGGEPASV